MKQLIFATFLVAAPLQASEWALGVDIPYPGEISLWRIGKKWGLGMTLGGPTIGKTEIDGTRKTTARASGTLTVQRLKGRAFFFGEVRSELYRTHWFNDRRLRMRAGAGISRRYKDFGLFISYGFMLRVEENDNSEISWATGLEAYPRVVAYWTL